MAGEHVQSAILAVAHHGSDPVVGRRERQRRLAMAIVYSVAILGMELLTPTSLTLGCLYMLLAVYTALKLDERIGATLLGATIFAGILIKHWQLSAAGATSGAMLAVEAWNGLTRLITICVFGVVLGRLVKALSRERKRAERDPLTGALNRRALIERLPMLAAATVRSREAVGLAYLDLDGFKEVNDRHGHAVGDALLCRFAYAAAVALGDKDCFARIGGDEFVAVLVDVDRSAVEARAAALQRRLTAELDDLGFAVSCSMGAAVAEATPALDLEPLIIRADRQMYHVKRTGKDALRVAHYLPEEIAPDRPGQTVTFAGRVARSEPPVAVAAVG